MNRTKQNRRTRVNAKLPNGGTARNGRPTDEYSSFQQAFDYFNAELFDGELPPCLITLQCKANTRGYFSSKRFETRDAAADTDEVALNPATFKDRTDKEISSTLVHEMCHQWQEHFGKPSRGGYHNRQWADKMEAVGLRSSRTGDAGGARTGQTMTHYILAGGRFEVACDKLLKSGFSLTWQSRENARYPNRRNSKIKYTCPQCRQNAWAKPEANLVCGHCDESMPHGSDPIPTRNRKPPEAAEPPDPTPAPDHWQPVVKKWFAEMSMRYHPDRGGTDEQMRVINGARDLLEELLTKATV
jgi:predicted SprT family Zn-dependent metalloprotease